MPTKNKELRRILNQRYRENNRESLRARGRAHWQANQDKAKAYNSTHREEKKAYQQAYYLANKDKLLLKHLVYRIAHQEHHRAYQRAYRVAHMEQCQTYKATHKKETRVRTQLYRQAHPESHRSSEHRRRARKMSALCTATSEQEVAIKTAYKGRCAYCGKRPSQLTIDHVVPLAKGGTHTPENLVPACKACNSAKRDKQAPLIPAVRLLL